MTAGNNMPLPPENNQHAATVSASTTLALSQLLVNRGLLDDAELQRFLGMGVEDLRDPDCRVPVTAHNRLWDFAIEATGDPALGLRLGEIVDPDRMGLMSHIAFNSNTLGQALEQYVRLHGLVNEAVEMHQRREGDQVRLIWRVSDPSLYCIPDMERTLSAAITRARHFIHPQLEITELTLAHEEPEYVAHYGRIFRCPLVFNASETSVCFAAHYLDAPLPHRNPYLYSALLQHVNKLIGQLRHRSSITDRVRRIISKQLPSGPDVDEVARAMNMSRQTLYRKLKREGESFQNLAETVRQELAMRYVAEGKYGMSEVAFLLGFSELSAFSRAFKRWTGETPKQYRARHRNGTNNR